VNGNSSTASVLQVSRQSGVAFLFQFLMLYGYRALYMTSATTTDLFFTIGITFSGVERASSSVCVCTPCSSQSSSQSLVV